MRILGDASFVNPADLVRAYLAARRRNPSSANSVTIPIVRDGLGRAVDFGAPSDWGEGTAARVLDDELHVEYQNYEHWDKSSIQVQQPLSRSLSISLSSTLSLSRKDKE